MAKIKNEENLIIPEHIAIILDGNGRWAKKRHLPRTLGHQKGTENIRTITLAASKLGVKALSVFAFSTENWSRPKDEVDFLMKLPAEFEKRFKDEFEKHDIKVVFSGRKTHLSQANLAILERIAEKTAARKGLVLNICFDYGSQTELVEATKAVVEEVLNGKIKVSEINEQTIAEKLYTKDLPQLDLLIRPSGEQRLSNFMLWQAAYAELYFCPTFWPDFNEKHLLEAIKVFNQRERRFGGLK